MFLSLVREKHVGKESQDVGAKSDVILRACLHQKALGYGSQMIMVPCFLDETIEKLMDYSAKFFEGHKLFSVNPNFLPKF